VSVRPETVAALEACGLPVEPVLAIVVNALTEDLGGAAGIDVTSAAKSSAILLSSLLSPYCRSRKAEGSSTVRRRPRAVAKISSRILKPCEEIAGATPSNASRRIMKWPLIGSVRSMPRRKRTSAFDQRLTRERCFDSPAAEPPSR